LIFWTDSRYRISY